MSFLRTLLMFVLVFSLLSAGKSHAGKIKNCTNCESNKSQSINFGNNSENQRSNQINFSDIECFFAFSDRAQCRVKRLSDLEICENIKKGRLSNVITEELFKNSLNEGKKRSLKCMNIKEKSSKNISKKSINNNVNKKNKCSDNIKAYKDNCYGFFIYKNGNSYEGYFKKNMFHGKGKYIFGKKSDYLGNRYEGEFKKGLFDGYGKYFTNDGDVYKGQFKKNKYHGFGKYNFKNGELYEGNWKYGKYDGIGTLFLLNGDKLTGQFKDGKANGEGLYIYSNKGKWAGYIYEGQFANGKRNGYGVLTYASGAKYEGNWKSDKKNGQGIYISKNKKITNGIWKDGKFIKDNKIKSRNKEPSISSAELKKEKQKRKLLEQKLASLEKEKQKRIEEEKKRKALEKKLAALQSEKKKQIKQNPSNEIGSGFYVSKFRHIVTNQHVVNKCKKITVGDSMTTQIPADLIASDKRNDLAILQTISMDMASAETKSFIQNLSIQIVPIVSGGLIRIDDVKGGEQVYVAGFPHGNMISDSMRLVSGLVNSTRGFENDITQFETDAVIRKGNSGGPVYDSKGNIVGIAVKRFNVTRSDNYNFAIKGSTVKQFLDTHNILTTPANRTSSMTSTKIYNIASKQTVMVVCHR